MTIDVKHIYSSDKAEFHQVTFFNHKIKTTVTSNPSAVNAWINNVQRIFQNRLNNGLVVGLDVEWQPNFERDYRNPVAVLQLCVGHHCLVYQLQYANRIPLSLYGFVSNENYTFVGVGIDGDVKLLFEDFDLEVARTCDLRELASIRYSDRQLRNVGLTALAGQVLGLHYNKPKNVTLSNWATPQLSYAQVQYASIDAFLSFEIGRCLGAAN